MWNRHPRVARIFLKSEQPALQHEDGFAARRELVQQPPAARPRADDDDVVMVGHTTRWSQGRREPYSLGIYCCENLPPDVLKHHGRGHSIDETNGKKSYNLLLVAKRHTFELKSWFYRKGAFGSSEAPAF